MKTQLISSVGNVTENKTAMDFVSTSLVGEIITSYKTLAAIFGKPDLFTGKENDGSKCDAEWTLQTPKGRATIYNYKDGKNYLGKKDGLATTKITEWHIGGQHEDALPYVLLAIYKNK